MPSRRIFADATARHLNAIAAPKHLFFRKARWEQAPDASELDGLCIFPDEQPKQTKSANEVTFNKRKDFLATTASQGAGTNIKSNAYPTDTRDIEGPNAGAGAVEPNTLATTVQDSGATPHIDVDFFIFAAVAFGLGAWNQPDLVNEICSHIRDDVKSMLNRLLPKPSNAIMCMALSYTNKLFGERHRVSVLSTGWGQSLVALRIIRLALTLAYKWHEDYPNSFECGLCPWEICNCAELNGWDSRGDFTMFPKDKNAVIKEIWKRTKHHPSLPKYALARMEMESLIALDFNVHASVRGVEWMGFLGRLRTLSNEDAQADGVSREGYRFTRLAIFELVEAALRDRFKRAKVA